jgi:hypothetical protein
METESCPAPRTPQDHEVDAECEGDFSRIVPLKLAFPVPELVLTVDEERDTELGGMLEEAKAETSDATHGRDATV